MQTSRTGRFAFLTLLDANRSGVGRTFGLPRRKEWENRGFPRGSQSYPGSQMDWCIRKITVPDTIYLFGQGGCTHTRIVDVF